MHNQFKIYCFVVYTPLNMFRALLCPSSGAPSNCLCSHWLPYGCRVGRASGCGCSLKHVQPGNHTVTSGSKGSWRGLLMMGTTVVVLINRPQPEARPTRQSYGNQWLQRQLEGAPDDGHCMLSGVYATKQILN
jgi:hypothetical protein